MRNYFLLLILFSMFCPRTVHAINKVSKPLIDEDIISVSDAIIKQAQFLDNTSIFDKIIKDPVGVLTKISNRNIKDFNNLLIQVRAHETEIKKTAISRQNGKIQFSYLEKSFILSEMNQSQSTMIVNDKKISWNPRTDSYDNLKKQLSNALNYVPRTTLLEIFIPSANGESALWVSAAGLLAIGVASKIECVLQGQPLCDVKCQMDKAFALTQPAWANSNQDSVNFLCGIGLLTMAQKLEFLNETFNKALSQCREDLSVLQMTSDNTVLNKLPTETLKLVSFLLNTSLGTSNEQFQYLNCSKEIEKEKKYEIVRKVCTSKKNFELCLMENKNMAEKKDGKIFENNRSHSLDVPKQSVYENFDSSVSDRVRAK